jgi:hypothetical protein
MRDFGVIFERVPLMCDNTSANSIAKKSSLPQKNETPWEETPLSERSRWEERHLRWDTLIQRDSWLVFSSNPLILLALLLCGGKLVFAIHIAWFEGELCSMLNILFLFAFLLYFPRTHLCYLASHVILACSWMIMPVIVLGWVEMRCETLLLDHGR